MKALDFVQGMSLRSENHRALRGLVSRIQIEFSEFAPNGLNKLGNSLFTVRVF